MIVCKQISQPEIPIARILLLNSVSAVNSALRDYIMASENSPKPDAGTDFYRLPGVFDQTFMRRQPSEIARSPYGIGSGRSTSDIGSTQFLRSTDTGSGQPSRSSDIGSGQPSRSSDIRSGQPSRPSDFGSGQPLRPSDIGSGQPSRSSDIGSGQPSRPSDFGSAQSSRSSDMRPTQPSRTDVNSSQIFGPDSAGFQMTTAAMIEKIIAKNFDPPQKSSSPPPTFSHKSWKHKMVNKHVSQFLFLYIDTHTYIYITLKKSFPTDRGHVC